MLILKKLLEEVILIRKYIVLLVIGLTLIQCQGTHGKVQSYSLDCSVYETINTLKRIDSRNSAINFRDSVDNSGLNRPGYCDLSISTNDGEITYFKIHFRGDEELWKAQPDECTLSIIEINGKINSKLGWRSTEKENGIKLFNSIIIYKLNKACSNSFNEE
jgi:hypothetical protein